MRGRLLLLPLQSKARSGGQNNSGGREGGREGGRVDWTNWTSNINIYISSNINTSSPVSDKSLSQ